MATRSRWALADRIARRSTTRGPGHLRPGTWTPADLAPVIEECLERFGPERCLFGSDWPVCTRGGALPQWLTALRLVLSRAPQEAQAQVLAGTARTWYRLPAAATDGGAGR